MPTARRAGRADTHRYPEPSANRPIHDAMARFRETLWFKKGDDLVATTTPAGDHERPLEDRYEDDGSVTGLDRAYFSLNTAGAPEPIGHAEPAVAHEDDTLRIVAGQLKGRRRTIAAMLGGSMAVVAAALTSLALLQ